MYLHNSAMRVGLSLSVLVIIGLTLGGVPSGSVSALPSHRQVQKLATPIGIAAHGDLCRLHRQEAQQRVALLADVRRYFQLLRCKLS